MKRIYYRVIGFVYEIDPETQETVQKEVLSPQNIPYSAENEERAKKDAYNGEYTIDDDGAGDPAPSQLDIIEAQVTYTAMMTDTLLEV